MARQERGFTLIELMIVVAIIAILASIAVPNLISGRVNANESAAIATLKTLTSAQAQCHASAVIDANGNGAGEFGYLGELSGHNVVRGSVATKVSPPVLSTAFGNLQAGGTSSGGVVIRSGYYFQLWLPSATGAGLVESTTGGATGTPPDPTRAETLWAAYAWPSSRGTSGVRAFFVNQAGDVHATSNAAVGQLYSGSTVTPVVGAAFLTGTAGLMSSTLAANTVGLDGGFWVVVN